MGFKEYLDEKNGYTKESNKMNIAKIIYDTSKFGTLDKTDHEVLKDIVSTLKKDMKTKKLADRIAEINKFNILDKTDKESLVDISTELKKILK